MSVETATGRLTRLLTMVPWLLANQGVPVARAAAEFGIDVDQLEADLALLFLCGTPGHLPDDLIEAEWENGRVFVGNADSIARPLRLTLDEALALMVGLRALADTPGVDEGHSVARALSRLEQAVGTLADQTARVHVSIGDAAAAGTLRTVQDALARRRRLHLRYLVPSRDEATERDVDPMRILNLDGQWYVEGWCHRAEAVRTFRVDRIDAVEVLDVDGTPPAVAEPKDLSQGLFVPAATDPRIDLEADAEAAWVGDYYPTESVIRSENGRWRIVLRTPDPDWVVRLVLRSGGHLRVVAPAGVADAVRARAAAALTAYDG